jgi:hypothetical protein
LNSNGGTLPYQAANVKQGGSLLHTVLHLYRSPEHPQLGYFDANNGSIDLKPCQIGEWRSAAIPWLQ